VTPRAHLNFKGEPFKIGLARQHLEGEAQRSRVDRRKLADAKPNAARAHVPMLFCLGLDRFQD
jgi:hypothetical protein